MFEQFLSKQPAPFDAKPALPIIAALEQADCPDALVRCVMGVLAQEAGQAKRALANLDRSDALQAKHPYPPVCMWVSGGARFEATVEVKGVAAANAAYEFIAKGWNDFAEALDEPRSEPGEERVLLSLAQRPLRTFGGAQRLMDALAKHPKADAYVAGVLQGQNYWSKVVGHVGMSSRKAAEKQAEFAGYLANARDGLTAAWKLHPAFPEAPGVMLSITALGYGGPGETPRTWFDRAVAAQFDYPPAYDGLIEALQLGDGAQLRQFAEECLATGRFDTGVPWRYYEALYAAGGFRDDQAYAGLKSVVAGYRTVEPAKDRDRRSRLLAAACGTARWDEAAALSKKLGGKPDLDALRDALGGEPDDALAELDAHAAGVAADYDAAVSAAQGGDTAKAVKLLTALEAGPGSDRLHRHVRGMLQGLKIQEALH
ncbi:MAG: hypothetical protein HYU66_17540 [Armatimonadetes bacterium]|nr:hypothetical protein [Armatimonadota bacterium]